MGSNLIREATREDAGAIRAIYAPIAEETATSFELEAPSVHAIASRIDETGQFFPWLILEAGAVLGDAYATRFRARQAYDWSCEVSVYVATSARPVHIASGLPRPVGVPHGVRRHRPSE